MEYHKTKDILHVKRLLGHKKLENTEIYTHLINFESDEWHVATAKNLDEESKVKTQKTTKSLIFWVFSRKTGASI